jgi:hypothetical protein
MSKTTKSDNGKITVRGHVFDKSQFKPISIDESEIFGIVEGLRDFADYARNHDIPASAYPPEFLKMEGLVRYQIEKLPDVERKFIPDELLSSSTDSTDLECWLEFVLDNLSNPKTKFLLDFLKDILIYCECPAAIDETALDRIAQNLRALSFLLEIQFIPSKTKDDSVFESFAYHVWRLGDRGCTKLSAQEFWNKAIKFLKDNGGSVQSRLKDGKKYSAELGVNKNGNDEIKIFDESRHKTKLVSKKTWGRLKGIWDDLEKEFIKSQKKISQKA